MDYVPGSAVAAGASNVPLAGSAEAQMAYMNQLWLARAQQEQQAAAAAAAALALGSGSRPTSFYDPSLYPEQHFLMTPLSAEPPHRVPSPHVPGGGQCNCSFHSGFMCSRLFSLFLCVLLFFLSLVPLLPFGIIV